MDINAVNDDPTELAKRYCKEHELDYIEQGTHVEVEIQKDMLQVCRVKIKDLLKQRKAMEEKIETLSNASVSVRLRQAVDLLKQVENEKANIKERCSQMDNESKNMEEKLLAKASFSL